MNSDKALLGIELRLLIARHGKARVSEVLSSIGDTDLATLDSDVKAYEGRTRKSKVRPRSRKSIDDLIQETNPENPDAERLIWKLALAYEDRRFLPDLREVKRFLESQRTSTAIQNPGTLYNTPDRRELVRGLPAPVRCNQILAGFMRDYKSTVTGGNFMKARSEVSLNLMRDSLRLSGRRPELEQIGNANQLTTINATRCDKDKEISSQNKELLSIRVSVR